MWQFQWFSNAIKWFTAKNLFLNQYFGPLKYGDKQQMLKTRYIYLRSKLA